MNIRTRVCVSMCDRYFYAVGVFLLLHLLSCAPKVLLIRSDVYREQMAVYILLARGSILSGLDRRWVCALCVSASAAVLFVAASDALSSAARRRFD